MRYLDEFRDPAAVQRLAEAIRAVARGSWRLMEVCGGQTHAIVRFGLDALLPPGVELLHGPGCPVCVTPAETIDRAVEAARRPDVTLCTFGDMLRVPGSAGDLASARAAGADVRVVYSPLDALAVAEARPDREVVFFGVGFETTAPTVAMAVLEARRRALRRFSVLAAHVLVPPALEALLADPAHRISGFLAAGHVCTVTGTAEYAPIARAHRVPIVITGFEPVDLLQGVYLCVRQLEEGRAEVDNQYARSVRPAGNQAAQRAMREVFEPTLRVWRGMGEIPRSGLRLRAAYRDLDAEVRLSLGREARIAAPGPCRSGEVLTGRLKPPGCPAFGAPCTPEAPLGPTMVSSEGACAAYFRYRQARG